MREVVAALPSLALTPTLTVVPQVTAVHKANVMTKADGLFLESCREQAILYPDIEFEEVLVDHCMMRLVSQPQRFDVMVTPNFYGSLVSNGESTAL